jgi:phenylpyruvate tautomerase PptA (4-oxalocrotonate tautomerase family)
MPLVRVEIFEGKSKEYKKALLDGIHNALVTAFKIPINDRKQKLYELSRENLIIGNNNSKNYTFIEITAFKGRSYETKKLLYTLIAGNLKNSPGIDGEDILIVLNEQPLENWGVHGGIPASEYDIGFNIKV